LTDYRNVRLNLETYRRLRRDADAHGRALGAHVAELLNRPAAPQAGDLAGRLDRLESGIGRIDASLQVLQVAVASSPDTAQRAAVRQPTTAQPPERAPAAARPAAKPPAATDKATTRKGGDGVQAVLDAARTAGLPTTARELVAWREEVGLRTQGDLAVLVGRSRQAVSNQENASGRGGDLDSELGTRFLRRLLDAREQGAL
jgi:hypothetical protein